MQKIEVLVGIPASSKSTYCADLMRKEPGVWKRLNNDAIRLGLDFSVWSPENEKIVVDFRKHMLKDLLKRGYSILCDNVNLGKRNWEEITKIAKEANVDCQVYEKIFFVDLEEAIERDSKRIGAAKVGEEVIRKFWKQSGGNQLKFRHPRVETFAKNYVNDNWEPMIQNEGLPIALICDLDNSLAKVGGKYPRSPYDASQCDLTDTPIPHTLETVKLYYQAGYKIIFCSGRMAKDRAPTMRFIEKHLPNMNYDLFTRKDGDQRRDSVIKEELFNEHIKDKYYVACVIDDRISVCRLWHSMGLNLFRVGDPDADF